MPMGEDLIDPKNTESSPKDIYKVLSYKHDIIIIIIIIIIISLYIYVLIIRSGISHFIVTSQF